MSHDEGPHQESSRQGGFMTSDGVFHAVYIPGIAEFALQVDLLNTWATVPQF